MDPPPRKRIHGASHVTNCFEIAPHTLGQGKRLKTHQFSMVHELSTEGSLNHKKDT